MASIYCRNGKWMVAYKDQDGKRHDKSFGVGDEGKSKAEQFIELLGRSKNQEITFSVLVNEYLSNQVLCGSSDRHIYSMKIVINSVFYPHFGKDTNITNIDYVNDILPFIDKLTNTPTKFGKMRTNVTINQYAIYLTALFNFAVKREYIKKSPMELWKPLKVIRKDRLITFEDACLIINNADEHIKWAIQLIMYLGVRPGKCELFNLKWTDVNFEENKIHVYSTKTNTHRFVNFNSDFADKLRYYKSIAESEYILEYKGRQLTTIKRGFATAVRKAGITYPVKPYDFRHLFATIMINKGADIAAVSKLMGHTRVSTTVNSYYEARSEEGKRAVSLLPKLPTDI